MFENIRIPLIRASMGLAIAAAIFALNVLWPESAASPFAVEAYDAGTRSLSLGQAQDLAPTQWHAVDTRRLSYAAGEGREIWLRMTVPAAYAKDKLVAEITTPNVRQVDFYLLEGRELRDSAKMGMDRPFANRPFQNMYAAYPFSPAAATARQLYIRASSQISVYLPLHISSAEEYQTKNIVRSAVLWLALGIFAGIVLYNLLICLSLRDPIYIYYCLYQVTICGLAVVITGGGQILNNYQATHFDMTMRLMCTMLLITLCVFAEFFRSFVEMKQNDPAINRLFALYSKAVILLTIPAWFAPISIVVDATLVLTALSCLVIAGGTSVRGRTPKELILSFGFVGLGTWECMHLLIANGFLPAPAFAEYITAIGGNWEALFFSLALANRISAMQAERKTIIATIKGDAPASALNAILGDSYAKSRRFSELNMSVMFIDVVGFSQISEILGTAQTFQHLANLMKDMTKIIEECHGTVDRSLGDGVLCFFGYEDGSRAAHHAQDAFNAARRIQEMNVGRFLGPSPSESFILPVRIGIHVADVMIGDLGGHQRVDFTVIGSGVNFASRLETACSPFKIMVSKECYNFLQIGLRQGPGFSEIHVAIKHQDVLAKAYEFDPFAESPGSLAKVERLYLDQIRLSPRDSRFVLPVSRPLHLTSELCTFRMIDFSNHGFKVVSNAYIGRKVTMLVELVTDDQKINEALKQTLLKSFYVEIRWSRRVEGGYEHGFKLFGLNGDQRLQIFRLLEALFQEQDLERGMEHAEIAA